MLTALRLRIAELIAPTRYEPRPVRTGPVGLNGHQARCVGGPSHPGACPLRPE